MDKLLTTFVGAKQPLRGVFNTVSTSRSSAGSCSKGDAAERTDAAGSGTLCQHAVALPACVIQKQSATVSNQKQPELAALASVLTLLCLVPGGGIPGSQHLPNMALFSSLPRANV